ncbi:MAG: ABC transporter permease [Oscillospiraceae bacterium]|nr:ABC transporter permease [Oscillospiraceae bacterium]
MKISFKAGSSLARRNFQKLISNKLAMAGGVIIFVMVFLAVFAPFFTAHDPSFVDPANRLLQPSSDHPLGTDSGGRDLVARLLYGGRISMLVGLLSALGSCAIGVVAGCISGYFGGKTDALLLYISEIVDSFPQTILVLIMVGVTGRGLISLILIFSFTGWMGTHRIVRGRIMALREEPFVESCKANGLSSFSIIFRNMLPNTLGPVIVSLTLSTARYVLGEASLSYIGLGVPLNIPTWGNIINAARNFQIMQQNPVIWIAPGITISLFVLGVNFFGDGLRDVFDTTQ